MAVIRCPNCGKPNPDFLEVCQYCDAQLHPAGAAPAAPPGASGSADDTLIRKPPAVPAASAPPTPPAEDTTPASEPQDWMSRLRGLRSGETAPQAAADEPDWMWTGQAADASIGPPPDTEHGEAQAPTHEDASGELPEWLRDLDQPVDLAPKAVASAAPAQPPAEAAAQPPVAASSPAPAAPAPAPEPSPFEPTASDATIPPRPRRRSSPTPTPTCPIG